MKITAEDAELSIRTMIDGADLDDLAELYSRYCADGKIIVSEKGMDSDAFEDGKRA